MTMTNILVYCDADLITTVKKYFTFFQVLVLLFFFFVLDIFQGNFHVKRNTFKCLLKLQAPSLG